jgi:hypothetical protein
MVVWEGEAQKGGFGAGTLLTRGRPCPLAPRYRQPSAAWESVECRSFLKKNCCDASVLYCLPEENTYFGSWATVTESGKVPRCS